jgi:PadR family transcriptional regulator PadR
MATRLNKQVLDGTMETILLSLLCEGQSYGYQIVEDLNARGGGLLELGEGTVYPVLHRLEGRGLIAATWRRGAKTGRDRKYYRVTAAGRRKLADNRSQWAGLVELMDRVTKPSAPGGATLEGGMV